jgi:hypothetical protein
MVQSSLLSAKADIVARGLGNHVLVLGEPLLIFFGLAG